MGSGCGLVGRAVASNTRGPWFEFSHRRFFYKKHLFTYCQLCCKDEKTKRPEMAHKKTNCAIVKRLCFLSKVDTWMASCIRNTIGVNRDPALPFIWVFLASALQHSKKLLPSNFWFRNVTISLQIGWHCRKHKSSCT